ncbi:3'-5' exonuclease [Candidatus Pelagisphaera phototrophica]|uniref:3'-5' exonuclease n=1 Tax=Candidatus Pelagisphaera phototrophica TaxID=2684113 RepID=UPI0019E1F884|nr:3'-5' exonuclease [Candidatus Pelagisphaera phototrophica]QXD32339.1 3'-5' exonuclease [Candidatus Pelagisphaera phototrophica]
MKPLNQTHRSLFHPLLGVKQLVVFDLETTGLRPKQEEITQIAAIELGGMRMEMGRSFCTYVNPGKPIPKQIQKLTRVRDNNVKNSPNPKEAIQAFSNFVGQATLFGHDIYRFDFQFISKHVRDDPAHSRNIQFIDTMDIFEALWPDFSRLRNSLDDIAERLSAGLSSIRRHDAKGDAILLAHVFQRIQDHPNLERLCSRVPVHETRLPEPLPVSYASSTEPLVGKSFKTSVSY